MRNQVVAALVLGASLAAGGASAAQLYDGVLVPELAQILKAGGMGVTEQTTDGVPFVIAQIPNSSISILVSGIACKDTPRCEGFSVMVPINPAMVKQGVSDMFNRKTSYARIATTDDGQPFLEGDYVAEGGVTDSNIANDFSAFFAAMQQLSQLTGGHVAENGVPAGKASLSAPGFAAHVGKQLAPAAGQPVLFLSDKAMIEVVKAQFKR